MNINFFFQMKGHVFLKNIRRECPLILRTLVLWYEISQLNNRSAKMPARETRFSGDDILMRIMAAVSIRAIPLYTILKQITCRCITRVNFKLNIKPPLTFYWVYVQTYVLIMNHSYNNCLM